MRLDNDVTKVWVNGCFDVLHIGHIRLLQRARELGEWVTVGLDTDEKIRYDKGPSRPFHPLPYRREMLAALRYVDEIVTFDSNEELCSLIKRYSPDVMVTGEEYRGRVVGGEYAKRIEYIEKVGGFSTTRILGDR
jgi:D-beta-D-heptose 7-phosphate kinase/D-beta-D-heptose 1-phosphate adenosyltransferase